MAAKVVKAFRLPVELDERLSAAASERGATRTDLVVDALSRLFYGEDWGFEGSGEAPEAGASGDHGDGAQPVQASLPAPQRFLAKVQDGEPGCWEWAGSRDRDGYGRFKLDGRPQMAHRVAFELWRGEIPDGLQIDHLCRNPGCVNPNHLEVVTSRENTLRGEGPAAENGRKTHCKRGHEFTEENTYLSAKGRECRICRREADRKRAPRNRGPLLPEADGQGSDSSPAPEPSIDSRLEAWAAKTGRTMPVALAMWKLDMVPEDEL